MIYQSADGMQMLSSCAGPVQMQVAHLHLQNQVVW